MSNSYPFSLPGMGFWLSWGAVGAGWEIVSILRGRPDLTLSYQVWCLASRSTWWARDISSGIFLLTAGILAMHFWGRFGRKKGS